MRNITHSNNRVAGYKINYNYNTSRYLPFQMKFGMQMINDLQSQWVLAPYRHLSVCYPQDLPNNIKGIIICAIDVKLL